MFISQELHGLITQLLVHVAVQNNDKVAARLDEHLQTWMVEEDERQARQCDEQLEALPPWQRELWNEAFESFGKSPFHLKQMYAVSGSYLACAHPKNSEIESTTRAMLQRMAKRGVAESVDGNGTWRLL